MHACMLSCFSHVRLFATLWTVAQQAPPSIGLSRQEYWSGLPFPSSTYKSRANLWDTDFKYLDDQREEDGKGSLKGPAEIPRENKGGTEPSKTPCILFAGTGFTIVSANPKISRLSPLSPTVPQKGLLSRHSLEVFVLFSVYFPF